VSDQDIFFKTGLATNVSLTTPVAINPISVNPLSVTPMAVSSIGPVGPVTVAGIPDTFHINIDHLPKLSIGVDPIELRLTELPSIRGHLPADFSVGLSILGIELMCVRLCGEAQIVTEPYRPNPCENCGGEFSRVAGALPSGQ
jgi:hypothetical protein